MYSPSSRDEYTFCPRSWWLRKNGWVPRTIDYPELCAIGGNAVGKAQEQWNISLMRGEEITLKDLLDIGEMAVRKSFIEELELNNRSLGAGRSVEFAVDLSTHVANAIALLWEQNPLKPYAILSAEEEFHQASKARLDVRVKQADGRQIVFDYKCKFGEFDLRWLDKEFTKHFTGEQRLTYTTLTHTDCFGIILAVLKPTVNKKQGKPQVFVRTVPVTEQEQSVWLQNTQLSTPYMDHILTIQSPKLVPARTYPHENQYGSCKWAKACLDYNLDEQLMQLDYIQVKKGGDNATI